MAGCLRGVEVTAVLLAAAGVAAGRIEAPQHERGNTMAAKKTTPKKATSRKQAPAKKSGKKMSGLDAAAKVLAVAKEPMNAKQMIEQMATKGYWKSPGGRTPHATLYSALLREIQKKGKDSRFKKTGRGLFAANK